MITVEANAALSDGKHNIQHQARFKPKFFLAQCKRHRLKRQATIISGCFTRKKDHSDNKQANMKEIEYQLYWYWQETDSVTKADERAEANGVIKYFVKRLILHSP